MFLTSSRTVLSEGVSEKKAELLKGGIKKKYFWNPNEKLVSRRLEQSMSTKKKLNGGKIRNIGNTMILQEKFLKKNTKMWRFFSETKEDRRQLNLSRGLQGC